MDASLPPVPPSTPKTKRGKPRKQSTTKKKKKTTPRKIADAVSPRVLNHSDDNENEYNDINTPTTLSNGMSELHTPTTSTTLSQIRELQTQVQQSRLLLLERDNVNDDDDDIDIDYTPVQSRKKKQKTGAPPPFVKRNLARVFIMDINKQQHDGYLAATSEKSVHFPARHFCSICGYVSNYTCVKCGQRYCCVGCYATHEDTRCLKHK